MALADAVDPGLKFVVASTNGSAMTNFRSLFNAITAERIEHLVHDGARPWLAKHVDHRIWLREFAARKGGPIPLASHEDLWELYALSRVSDVLLTHQFPNRGCGSWTVTAVSADEYLNFMLDLGLERRDEIEFSPFFHEIVEVDQSSDPAGINDAFVWPAN